MLFPLPPTPYLALICCRRPRPRAATGAEVQCHEWRPQTCLRWTVGRYAWTKIEEWLSSWWAFGEPSSINDVYGDVHGVNRVWGCYKIPSGKTPAITDLAAFWSGPVWSSPAAFLIRPGGEMQCQKYKMVELHSRPYRGHLTLTTIAEIVCYNRIHSCVINVS